MTVFFSIEFDVQYGYGSHLSHVTKAIFMNLCPLFQRRLHINFDFD